MANALIDGLGNYDMEVLKRAAVEHPLAWAYERRRRRQSDRALENVSELVQQGLQQIGAPVDAAGRLRLLAERMKRRRGFPDRVPRVFCVYLNSWERESLIPELSVACELHALNVGELPERYVPGEGGWHDKRSAVNRVILERLRSAHREQEFDLFFAYLNASVMEPRTIRTVTEELGIPAAQMSLDDRHNFLGPVIDGTDCGTASLAPYYDVNCTSTLPFVDAYQLVGAIGHYFPEGSNPDFFTPQPTERDVDVSFVGARYGRRGPLVKLLRRGGVDVQTYGRGWPTPRLSSTDMVSLMSRSKINLGHGGVDDSRYTCLKARDFDVPMAGGFYMTTYDEELADLFEDRKEIVLYRSEDECLELVRHYLRHPEEARSIASAGHARALSEHRWKHRFERLFDLFRSAHVLAREVA